jgi:hypothetical protein
VFSIVHGRERRAIALSHPVSPAHA